MNNKSNIFEELNKMKSLIYAKSGTIISEQTPFKDIQTSVDAFKRASYGMIGTNIVGIKNVLNSIPDKNTFIKFFNKINTDSGKSLGRHIADELESGNATGALDIANIIKSKFGIDVDPGVENGVFKKRFRILFDKPNSTEDVTKVEEMWKDQKVSCVLSQPNVKKETLSNGSTAYLIGPVRYYANGRKQLADGTMTNYNCSTEFRKKEPSSGQPVNDRFSKSAESLGIQGGKMDLQTLQAMLKALEGEQQTTTTSSTTQGSPDLTQLTNMLTQLQS